MNDDLPEVNVSPARKVFLSGASVVWIIPLLALVAALYVAWQSYNSRGPLITIEFEQGAGIKAGETELRYRDVTVGVVEKVGFSGGLEKVIANVRVDKDVAPFIDSGSVFWIVQPEVSAQGITGLSTVLSGVYIEGSWDETPGAYMERFQGASVAPLIRPGQSGLQLAFRTVANGQLTDNAPILFKGIEVGKIGRAEIAPRGNFAIVEALIYEDHRHLINESTRFWDTSGFSVNISPAGAEIDFSSIATLVGGGVTFDTFVSGGGQVQDGTVFEVFPDKESARNSLFNASSVDPLEISVIFDDNISGLAVGAPVELSGFKIGEVSVLSGVVNPDEFGDARVRLNANLSIQPARLGLPGEVTAANALDFLQGRVEAGLRARLASASLLTGGLKVEFVLVDDAPDAVLESPDGGLPVMPTTENETSDAAATVEGVFTRINNLPIEELLNSAITFLDSAETLISSEDLRATPTDVRALLADLQGLVTSDDVQNIPVSLNATLERVEALVAELERQRIAESLSNVLTAASSAATAVETSVAGLPDLLTQIEAVAAKVESLSLEELVTEVTELSQAAEALLADEDLRETPADVRALLAQLQGLVASEAVQNIPVSLNTTLGRVDALVAELERQRIAENLASVLASAASAATAVETSVAGVPDLVTRIEAVAAKVETLAIEELITEVTALSTSAEALLSDEDLRQAPADVRALLAQVQGLIGSEEVRNVPVLLNAMLTRVEGLVAQLEEEQIVARLGTVLADASDAATAVESSVAGVPELVEQIQAVAAKADSLAVEELVTELTALTASADTLIASEDARALPGSLKRALDEVNYTLQELREGGAIENVNRTLASARNAADNIAVSAQDLPRIVDRLTALFAQAGRTIEGYNRGDDLTRAAQSALREIQKAADALASLARTIERNPNSLLLGR